MADYFYDPAADERRLKRRRRDYDELVAAMNRPYAPLIDAGRLKVANWGDALGRVADAWAAKRAGNELDRDEADTTRQQTEYTREQNQRYFDARHGLEVYFGDDTRKLDETGGDTPESVISRTGGNAEMARLLAQNSRIPELMELAKRDAESDAKLLNVPGATVASRVAARTNANPALLQSDVKPTVVNNQVFNTTDQGMQPGQQPALDARDKFSEPTSIPGAPPGTIGQSNLGTNEIKRLTPPPATQVNVDATGGNSFERAAGADAAKFLRESGDKAQQLMTTAQRFAPVEKLIDQAITGAGANVILEAQKWFRTIGMSEDKVGKITNSETLRSLMAESVFANIKNLGAGTGLSDADRQFAEKVSLSDLSSDPRAMKNAVRIMQAGAYNEYLRHQNEVGSYAQRYGPTATNYDISKHWSNASVPPGIERGPDGRYVAKLENFQPGGAEPAQPAASPGILVWDNVKKRWVEGR